LYDSSNQHFFVPAGIDAFMFILNNQIVGRNNNEFFFIVQYTPYEDIIIYSDLVSRANDRSIFVMPYGDELPTNNFSFIDGDRYMQAEVSGAVYGNRNIYDVGQVSTCV